jgi:hypothetical protein
MVLLAVLPAWAAEEDANPADLLLPEGFPPIGEAERALREVPGSPGAPAVVLLEATQLRWQGLETVRIRYLRRVKVLTEDGVEDYGDFSYTLYGDARLQTATARTLLPDGTAVDAAGGIYQEKSEAGFQIVRVAFPKVQAGAILEVFVSLNQDNALAVNPWLLQESIPVLESRFAMIPPPGLHYRYFVVPVDGERHEPEQVRFGQVNAFVWSFRDLPPIPNEANLPPIDDISRRLFVVLESYQDDLQYIPISTNWKTYSKLERDFWEDWTRRRRAQSEGLARQVAAAEGPTVRKAEAIGRALRERVRVDYVSDAPRRDSADDLLSGGSGTTADIAATAAVMLRAVGVPADLVAIRRRSDGAIPGEVPIPGMFNDVLVRIPSEGGGVFWSPAADLVVGRLPWDCTGLLALVLDGKAEAPVVVPDVPADQNRRERRVTATLDAGGNLSGEAVLTFHAMAAEPWRRRLRDSTEELRREIVQQELSEGMPGATVSALAFEGIGAESPHLVIRCSFETPGFATAAGRRLLLNPVLFDRIAAADWAAEQRRLGIHLRVAREEIDSISIRLPAEVTDVTLPEPANLKAEPAGFYRASYASRDGSLTLERHYRLDIYSFPAASWPGLRGWFGTMAEADSRPVVLTLG